MGDIRKTVNYKQGCYLLSAIYLYCYLLSAICFAAFDDLGAGARGAGMGGAQVASVNDAYSVYYNPAGLGYLERPHLASSYSKLFWGLSDNSDIGSSFIAYAHPLGMDWGGLAAAWQLLSLSGLYSEQSFYASWGLPVVKEVWNGRLTAGTSLKYLRRSFGGTPEAKNSLDKLTATGLADPVLTQSKAKGVFDADLGFLFASQNNYSVGIAVSHVNQPNVAFSPQDKDTLPLTTRLGLGYHALWMDFAAQAETKKAPDASLDKTFRLGMERWFPSLNLGDFALRAGMALGSRDFKQVSLGLSYRVARMQFDYGFQIPLGTVEQTMGSHHLGFNFFFGGPTLEDQYARSILEKSQTIAQAVLTRETPPSQTASLKDIQGTAKLWVDKGLSAVEQADYIQALRHFEHAARILPINSAIQDRIKRLSLICSVYPKLESRTDPKVHQIEKGLNDYLDGKNSDAIPRIAYALSLEPEDQVLEGFLAKLESATGITAERTGMGSPLNLVERKLLETLIAFRSEKYDRVINLCSEVLSLEPDNVVAYKRMGSSFYAMRSYDKAMEAWQKAVDLEKNPESRKELQNLMEQVRRQLIQPRPVSRPAPMPQAGKVKPSGPDPKLIEEMYLRGVSLFVQRQFKESADVFQLILKMDPENTEAQNALRRALKAVQTEERK